jgi:uncharacterized phiE125 gp8 family phage protein
MDYGLWPGFSAVGMRVVVAVPPSVEPVTVAEAKQWARVEFPDHDTLFADLITAVRQAMEADCRMSFITQTRTVYLGGFRSTWSDLQLPYPPLQSIVSVKYQGFDGVLTTIDPATYRSAAGSIPGRLWLPYGIVWPITGPYPDAVQVTYTCGYGDTAASVPMSARMAMRSLIAANYNNAEAVQFLQGGVMTSTPLYNAFIRSLDYGFYG